VLGAVTRPVSTRAGDEVPRLEHPLVGHSSRHGGLRASENVTLRTTGELLPPTTAMTRRRNGSWFWPMPRPAGGCGHQHGLRGCSASASSCLQEGAIRRIDEIRVLKGRKWPCRGRGMTEALPGPLFDCPITKGLMNRRAHPHSLSTSRRRPAGRIIWASGTASQVARLRRRPMGAVAK